MTKIATPKQEYAKSLVLTSPPEHGARVSDARYLLAGNNVFKQDFGAGAKATTMNATISGAVRRCKDLLGYPTRATDQAFGQVLYEYLTGTKKLPLAYQVRRKLRMAQLAKSNTAKFKGCTQALLDAKAGIHESPAGSNLQKYGAWYGFNGVAWCCIAITYWLVAIGGSKWWTRGSFASYVGAVVAAAVAGDRHLSITENPEFGDLVIYEHDEHIEFWVKWVDRAAGTFESVGGNTSSSDGSYNNGGEVGHNTRNVSTPRKVTNFIRVGQ